MSIRKNIPQCPKAPGIVESENVRVYAIELVTPMFGGGVSSGVNDPCLPIRPTSIRGQLQFWWRATVGAQYATTQDLRAAQSAIWGDTTMSSRIQVHIDSVKHSKPAPCAFIEWDQRARGGQGLWKTYWQDPFNGYDSALPYLLFPFQGKTPPPNRDATVTTPPASCIREASFRLTLKWQGDIDFVKQIEPAIWAWANFGGLGSRTRRGCGSILCKALAPKNPDDLKVAWQRFMPESFPLRDWPTLADKVLQRTNENPGGPILEWNYVIGKFRHFRQGLGFGRNLRQQPKPPGRSRYSEPETNRNQGQKPDQPGRSRYPEPETIRRVMNQRLNKHARQEQIPDDAFPRAEFGLPIVFHFQSGDPDDTVLYPDNDSAGKKRERMASPLILKPLALQSGKAIPLILELRTHSLTGVDLRLSDRSVPLPTTTTIRDPKLARYPNAPLAGSSTGSAIEAFLAFARSEGFTEVNR